MTSLACELGLTIGTERFWQIFAGPHISSLDRISISFVVIMILGHNKWNMNLLIPEQKPRKDNIPNFCCGVYIKE